MIRIEPVPEPLSAPLPEIVSGSAEVTLAATCSVAPDDTVVVLRVVPSNVSPRAFASVIFTVPTEMDVVPVYVLAAVSVSVPVPVPPFVSPAAVGVVAPDMTPETVASMESDT